MAAEEDGKAENLLLCSQQGLTSLLQKLLILLHSSQLLHFAAFLAPSSFSYAKIHGCALGERSPENLTWCFQEPPGSPGTHFGFLQAA